MNLTRHSFVRGAVAMAGLALGQRLLTAGSAHAQTTTEKPVPFRWRVPTAHQQTVENALVFDGSVEEERDTKGLPLVVVFVGVAMLPSLVDALLTLRRRLVQPGLKIDARGPEIKIDVDPTLPRGTILLIDSSGAKLLYEPNQLTEPAEMARALIGAKSK